MYLPARRARWYQLAAMNASALPFRPPARHAISAQAGLHAIAPAPEAAAPEVTVIVTSHGYARFLPRALASVAAQTYPRLSCVIVDDNSPDDSAAVARAWIAARRDPRFRLIAKQRTEGQLAAIATGLAAGDGPFVALLDADDMWHPGFLAAHIGAHLSPLGFAGLSCSDMEIIDAADHRLTGTSGGEGFWPRPGRQDAVSFTVSPLAQEAGALGAHYLRPDLFRWHWTATSAMVFRRAMLELVMPDPVPRGRLCADHYLAQFVHFFGGSILIDAVLGSYRRHGGNRFACAPVLASRAAMAPPGRNGANRDNLDTMLCHVLDRRADFAAAFSDRPVRALIGALAAHQIRVRGRLLDPRARAVLGRTGLIRARRREWWRRLSGG